jgi:hypothetical protein
MLIVDRRQWVWLVSYKNAGSVDVYDTRRQRTFKCGPHTTMPSTPLPKTVTATSGMPQTADWCA